MHRDSFLSNVQHKVSGKVFKHFYGNYIDAYKVQWHHDVLQFHTDHCKKDQKETGVHNCLVGKEAIDLTLMNCGCQYT